ncbi:carbon storage regulator [bacterium]|nr:carbon storage regulator [bacterium]
MLVLTRKVGESIVLNGTITVRVLSCKGRAIRLAIDAPKDVPIAREELISNRPQLSSRSIKGNASPNEAFASSH